MNAKEKAATKRMMEIEEIKRICEDAISKRGRPVSPFTMSPEMREFLFGVGPERVLNIVKELIDLKERESKFKAEARAEVLKHPEINDFLKGVIIEAQHQRKRWGSEHDGKKSPDDWLWLIAYLSTKATQAVRYGDQDKYLHHIITTAAACVNWHEQYRKQKPLKRGMG